MKIEYWVKKTEDWKIGYLSFVFNYTIENPDEMSEEWRLGFNYAKRYAKLDEQNCEYPFVCFAKNEKTGSMKGSEKGMTNKEAAEIILNYNTYGCGYCHEGGDEVPEAFDMAAKALLEAQEPVEPTIGGDADGPCGNWWYQCGKCKEAIDYHDKYCRNCGRAVKWDD